MGNFEGAVDLCLNDGRYAEAILLAISGGEELLKSTQQKYLSKQKNSVSMVSALSSVRLCVVRVRMSDRTTDLFGGRLHLFLTFKKQEMWIINVPVIGKEPKTQT